MRWRHFWIAVALVGIELLAFAGSVVAQESTKPETAAAAAESADTLDDEVLRLSQAGRYVDAVPLARRVLATRRGRWDRTTSRSANRSITWPSYTWLNFLVQPNSQLT